MPRKPRIHYPGAVHHVILRGNAGDPIFFNDRDRYRLYLILQYAVEKFGCRIHGFCLMTNHIHMVVQAGEVPLSRIMQNISLRYTRWINNTQRRTGHVFQGRYKALLIDADSYLLELIRYIHLNPVRAGMSDTVEDYPWSSHPSYLGRMLLPWLTTDWLLSLFSSDLDTARTAYRQFVTEGTGEERRNEFHCGTCEGRILGDDAFVDAVMRQLDLLRNRECSLDGVIEAVCRRYAITEPQLKAPGKARPYTEARALAAAMVLELPNISLTELGRRLNRDIATLGRAARFADLLRPTCRVASLSG